jgi:hypothetical protein
LGMVRGSAGWNRVRRAQFRFEQELWRRGLAGAKPAWSESGQGAPRGRDNIFHCSRVISTDVRYAYLGSHVLLLFRRASHSCPMNRRTANS